MDHSRSKEKNEQGNSLAMIQFDSLKTEVLSWLDGFTSSDKCISPDWSQQVKLFTPVSDGEMPELGLKLRIAFHLYTTNNQYLVTVIESIELKDAASLKTRSVYILSAHLNWKNHELKMKKQIEQSYGGPYEDILSTSHTVWIQTVKRGEFHDALNSCAAAILANELKEKPKKEDNLTPVQRPNLSNSILDIPIHPDTEDSE